MRTGGGGWVGVLPVVGFVWGLWVCGGGRVFRRCPTLPRPVGRLTIGAGGLSLRVRDGSGRFPSAVATGTPGHPHGRSHPRGVWSLGYAQWTRAADGGVRVCGCCPEVVMS